MVRYVMFLAAAAMMVAAVPIQRAEAAGMSRGDAFNACRAELGTHRTEQATRACVAEKMRGK
jgi:hypothetical protein